MAFNTCSAMALAGASLSLAGSLAPGLALAQTPSSRSLVISSPIAGASVPNPFTVSISLAPSGGGGMGRNHHGQAFLVIDAPTPAAGVRISADAEHIAFPPGAHQLSVSLPAGPHHLQIVAANHQGKVTYKVQPSLPMAISVQ